MLDPTEFAERLEQHVNAIVSAGAPSDVFRALLDGFALASPRTAMFLVRQGSLMGWSSTGHGGAESERIRGARLPAGSGWPGRLTAPDGPDRAFRTQDDRDDVRDLGEHERRESLGSALRVGGRTLAVLLSERDPGERPWNPAAMGMLMTIAGMRLEVDLARRRLRRETPAESTAVTRNDPSATGPERSNGPTTEPVIAGPDRSAEAPVAPPDPRTADPAAAPGGAGLAAAPGDVGPAAAPEIEAARRFARLIATDIRLYNEEDVLLGRKNGDLQQRIRDHLTRGQETFRRRYPSIGDVGDDILHEAYVRVLAGGDARLIDAGQTVTDRGGPES